MLSSGSSYWTEQSYFMETVKIAFSKIRNRDNARSVFFHNTAKGIIHKEFRTHAIKVNTVSALRNVCCGELLSKYATSTEKREFCFCYVILPLMNKYRFTPVFNWKTSVAHVVLIYFHARLFFVSKIENSIRGDAATTAPFRRAFRKQTLSSTIRRVVFCSERNEFRIETNDMHLAALNF